MTKYQPILISLDQNTDIGYVAINTLHHHDFSVQNKNDFPVQYQWKYTVFEVEPSSGVLLPRTNNKFRISFKAHEAAVTVGTIVFQTDNEQSRIFKLSVILKYSHLVTTTDIAEFPPSTVGKTLNKKIVIKNTSVVNAVFAIKNKTALNSKDNPFSVTPVRGEIPPKSTYEFDVKYTPIIPNMTYNSEFVLECQTGSNISIFCHAKSTSFDVKLTPRSVNFGEVKLESSTNRALTLHNNSDIDAEYQFFCEIGNVFSIVESKGYIPSNSFKKIIIQFDPKNTITYYERIYCIIRNHKLLYVDLMGTCFDLLIKPLPIVQIHVDLFRRRVIEGRLSEIDFKYLESNLQIRINKKLELLRDDKNLASLEQFDIPEINSQETQTALFKQLFLEGSNNQLLTLSTDFVDFGHCDTMTISSQQQIIITNNLPCKMTLYWIAQKRENFNGDYMTVFQIYPESATIKPGASIKFSITFRPLKSQYFFFQHLQYFALKQGTKISKKTLQDYEKKQLKTMRPETTLLRTLKVTQTIQSKVTAELESSEVMPPLHGIVRCVGNSFGIPSSAYIPIMKVSPSPNVIFAPSPIGQSTYQTIKLINDSDTPTYFKVAQDVNKIFRVFPKAGLIEGKSFQILTFEFNPNSYKTYTSSLPVHLNGSNGNPLVLTLHAECPEPKIRIPHNKLFFSKAFLGVYSKQSFIIQNLSRIPVSFKAQIPEKYQEEIFLTVKQKKLDSNEILPIELYFIPQFKKQYKVRIPIRIVEENRSSMIGYHIPGSGSEVETLIPESREDDYFIQVFGEGGDGSLLLEKEQIDFGVVKVLQHKKIQVKLKNLSDCTFYIELGLKSNTKDVSSHDIQNSFHLDFIEGTVVAKGQTLIGITFSPLDVMDFDLSLLVSARQKTPKILKLPSKHINITKCAIAIKAQGSYPLLQVVDVRNDSLSVTALWESFQLSKINHAMSTNLTSDEKKYLNIQTLPFAESQKLQQKLGLFIWNFGYISSKNASKTRRVLLTVKNFGGIDLDYNFKFPFDNAVEKQIWADPGEPTPQQAYEKAIVNKNIFEIRPKADRLKPGEIKDIELMYTPAHISPNNNAKEQHSLKVILEVKNGKAMVLNLKGTTLGPQQGLLMVKKKTYTLPDTPIGMITPLKFPIQLQNVGSAKIFYSAKPLYQNGQFEQVFRILNTDGSLNNSEKGYMYCTFKPLEKKDYKFKILIKVENSEKVVTQTVEIELLGRGSDGNSIKTEPKRSIEDIPRQRSLVSDVGSKVFFSVEQIDFEVMSPLQTTYKMVIIYNLSNSASLSFNFPQQNLIEPRNSFTCGDKFVVEPSNGEIPPNEFIELKITLTTSEAPSFYEGEIEANIFWNSKELPEQKSNDKQTLFLRVRKEPKMTGINNNLVPRFSPEKTIFNNIFSNIIQSTLTNTSLLSWLQKADSLPPSIIDLIPEDSGANIQKIDQSIENIVSPKPQVNNSDYRSMFVNSEFLSTGEIIMQNTFFNIIQQTTHKENDLLRVTKKFVTSNLQQ